MNMSLSNLGHISLLPLFVLVASYILCACGVALAVSSSGRLRAVGGPARLIVAVWRGFVRCARVVLPCAMLLSLVTVCCASARPVRSSSRPLSPLATPRETRRLIYKKKVILGTFPDNPAWINILNRLKIKEELHEHRSYNTTP